MYILLGAGLLAVATLLFSWAYGAMRRPDASRWAKRDATAVTMSLLFSTFASFGTGLFLAGMFNFASQFPQIGAAGLAASAAVLAGAGWASPRLTAPARRTGLAVAGGLGGAPHRAGRQTIEPGPRPQSGSRKRAA